MSAKGTTQDENYGLVTLHLNKYEVLFEQGTKNVRAKLKGALELRKIYSKAKQNIKIIISLEKKRKMLFNIGIVCRTICWQMKK